MTEHRDIDNTTMELANSLCRIRQSLKLTQKDVEAKSGIHQADISRIERGMANPSLDTIIRLAASMNKRVRIEFDDDPYKEEKLNYNGKLKPYLLSDKIQGDYTVSDFADIPENMSFELIDGVIYDIESPGFAHQDITSALYSMILDFAEAHGKECKILSGPFTLCESTEDTCKNRVLPDVGVVFEKTDFICEVVSSESLERDYQAKKNLYKKLGVKEYWILDPLCRKLTVYTASGNYRTPKIYENSETVGLFVFNNELTINLKGIWRFADN